LNTIEFSLRKVLIIALVAPLISYSFLDSYQAVASIFILTLLFWFTGAIPLAVTALLVTILTTAFGLVKPDRISFVDALRWLMEFDGTNRLGQFIVLPLRTGRSKPRIKKRHDRGYQFRFKALRERKAEWKQQCTGLS
jgi:hypothetical protein